ncbi:MAG: GNAT family N-acetyltransferase [Calditrichia bacterium]
MTPFLQISTIKDLDTLVPLVKSYHQFEGISKTNEERNEAILPLLQADSSYGKVYLIQLGQEAVGYIALCYGYSIEFGGRDAFIDEFYLVEKIRGKKIGSRVLELIKIEAARLNIKALHLEVANSNQRAKKLYQSFGLKPRERFQLLSCEL